MHAPLHEEFLQRDACKRGRPPTGKVFVSARCNIGREYLCDDLSSLIKGVRQIESIFVPHFSYGLIKISFDEMITLVINSEAN